MQVFNVLIEYTFILVGSPERLVELCCTRELGTWDLGQGMKSHVVDGGANLVYQKSQKKDTREIEEEMEVE